MLLFRIRFLISLFHIAFLNRLFIGFPLFLDFLFKLLNLDLRLTLLLSLILFFFLLFHILLLYSLLLLLLPLSLFLRPLLLSLILLILPLFLLLFLGLSCLRILGRLSFLLSLLLLLSIPLLLLLQILLLLLARKLVFDLLLTLVEGRIDLVLGQLLSFVLIFAFPVGELLELGYVETVHVVHVGVDSACEIEGRVESQVLVLGETWLTNFFAHADLDKFDVACP